MPLPEVPTLTVKEADACPLRPAKSPHANPPGRHSLPSIASRGRPLAHRGRVSCRPPAPFERARRQISARLRRAPRCACRAGPQIARVVRHDDRETFVEPGRYRAHQESKDPDLCVEFHVRELMSQDCLIKSTG